MRFETISLGVPGPIGPMGPQGPAGSTAGNGVTFADLPSPPVAGMQAFVTDGASTTIGAPQTGGGTSPTLVWYNGTQWTVTGI
jgi:hypothetical protein